jgi:hypothetical protein
MLVVEIGIVVVLIILNGLLAMSELAIVSSRPVRLVGRGFMQIIRECRMRAAILTGLAKDAPELENQLLYVAKEYLTLVILSEQLNVGADRAAQKLPARD